MSSSHRHGWRIYRQLAGLAVGWDWDWEAPAGGDDDDDHSVALGR
jgi:hypothetical protein